MRKRYSISRSVSVYSILSGGAVSPGAPLVGAGEVLSMGFLLRRGPTPAAMALTTPAVEGSPSFLP